ncbi:MAG TPA: DUF167 domain-containing protein [Gemmatimonadaceae bacterium]
MPLDARPCDGGVRVTVRVQPRAARTGIAGVHGTALKVRVSAPPVDGAANDVLVQFLAERFGVPRRAVRVVAGHASRTKIVELDGVSVDAVRRAADEG